MKTITTALIMKSISSGWICNDTVDNSKKKDKIDVPAIINITDKKAIKKMVEEAFKENPLAVKEYKQGNDKSLNYLVGVVMKKTKGKADPGLVSKIVKENI